MEVDTIEICIEKLIDDISDTDLFLIITQLEKRVIK